MVYIGIDLGGTNIAAGILDERNVLICKKSMPFPRGRGTQAVIDVCTALDRALLTEAALSDAEVSGVGTAVPGSVDIENGVVIDAHNLDFHHTPLAGLLHESLQKPIAVINDADAAALAEHGVGALKGTETSIMITIGTLHKEELLMPDGTKQIRDVVDIGATLDERIADGFYFGRSLRLVKHIFAHPELLDRPLGEDSGFEY